MKYVILIHSNPEPWGHPTSPRTVDGGALPAEQHQALDRDCDALMEELAASGELVTAEALAAPASSTLHTWSPSGSVTTDGPYAESKEQLAGFFVIDCSTPARAAEIAARFTQPGDTVELRPVS